MEFVDRRAATQRVAFAEDLLKVAVKQFVDTVIHNNSPWLLTVAPSPLALGGVCPDRQYDSMPTRGGQPLEDRLLEGDPRCGHRDR
jgi:hypothetical protein